MGMAAPASLLRRDLGLHATAGGRGMIRQDRRAEAGRRELAADRTTTCVAIADFGEFVFSCAYSRAGTARTNGPEWSSG
jgi:hypothetical protein